MSGVLVFSWVILITVSLVGSRGLPARTLGGYIISDGTEREIPETEVKQVVNVLEIEPSQAETLYGQLAPSRRTRQVKSGIADDMIGNGRPHFGELEENTMAYEAEEQVSEGKESKAGQWQPRFGELENNMMSHRGKERKSEEAEGPHQK